jgi:hypothetical protein
MMCGVGSGIDRLHEQDCARSTVVDGSYPGRHSSTTTTVSAGWTLRACGAGGTRGAHRAGVAIFSREPWGSLRSGYPGGPLWACCSTTWARVLGLAAHRVRHYTALTSTATVAVCAASQMP